MMYHSRFFREMAAIRFRCIPKMAVALWREYSRHKAIEAPQATTNHHASEKL
jgi:hypothetical protein